MATLAELSRNIIPVLWALWCVIWLATAFSAKPTRWREPPGAAALNRLPALVGALMVLAPQFLPAALRQRFMSGPDAAALGTIIVAAGLVFSVWARCHLGRNWSGNVTIKEDHALIESGPYRWLRHPIYTGMLVGLFGTALAIGAPYGFIGTALILVGLLVKLRAEEERMRATFPGAYDRYSARTARLIPGVY